MVNEHYDDKYEGHEEGEYHFSDDQANYDMDMDGAVKTGTGAGVIVPSKESIAEKLKQHRRIVIGMIVFIVLIGIVYKLVSPTNTPVTDFQPGETSASAAKAAANKKPITPRPVAAPQQVAQQQMTVAQQQQPAMQTTTMAQQQAQPVTLPQQQAPVVMQNAPAAPANDATRSVLDRVATLEQQNTAMMNLMQTQYTQKIADSEAQNTQLRTQVQELNSRISNMEVAFRQLTKILKNGNSGGAAAVTMGNNNAGNLGVPPVARVSQPTTNYTVQAIIPGRAWLKSDAGDTVTVAEGDVLKDVGRITKIDPYDGIVDIDTGSKIISLSYGVSGD